MDINKVQYQWGSTSGNKTITLPHAMTTTSYGCCVQQTSTQTNYEPLVVHGTTVTQIKVKCTNTDFSLNYKWHVLGF